MKKSLFLTLGLFLGTVLLPQVLSAQSAPQLDLSVDPATDFLQVKPGQKAVHSVTLTHNGTLPLQVTPRIVDFVADGQSGQPLLSDQASVDFITLQNPDMNLGQAFSLAPHTSKKIELVIAPTADTVPREYPLTLLFESKPANPETTIGTSSQTSAIIGSNLVIFVGDDSTVQGEMRIEKLDTSHVIDSFQPLKFAVTVFNDSAKSVPIQGTIKITDWLNRELINYDLEPDVVLGKSSRLVRQQTENEQDLTTQFIFDKPFLLGFYSIEVILDQPQTGFDSSLTMTRRVIAFPISIIVMLAIATGLYLVLRKRTGRMFND